MAHSRVIAMKRTAKAETALVELGSLDEFTERIVRMFESRYRSYLPSSRDDEVRYILEKVVNCLRANVRELRTYSRADQVRKPAAAKGEI
jgi:cysteinyl-tRNA synthetase